MSFFGDLTYNVTSKSLNSATSYGAGIGMNYLKKLLGGKKDAPLKFYYQYEAGGSILQVLAKKLIGGAVDELKDEAVNAFKGLFKGGDGESGTIGTEWNNRCVSAQKEEMDYCSFPVNNGERAVIALDEFGYKCYDALMLGIQVDKKIHVQQNYWEEQYSTYKNKDGNLVKYHSGNKKISNDIPECDHLVWYDCTAIINISSAKNIIITPVQGRDFSRKELVSNGDYVFSVSGSISSGMPDIYPTKEIDKLQKIFEYKGIVEVRNLTLNSRGINRILIQDFSLTQREGYKAIQEYSFNAIALQPEKQTEITEDTLNILDRPFETKKKDEDKWADLLKSQVDALKGVAIDAVEAAASAGAKKLSDAIFKKGKKGSENSNNSGANTNGGGKEENKTWGDASSENGTIDGKRGGAPLLSNIIDDKL